MKRGLLTLIFLSIIGFSFFPEDIPPVSERTVPPPPVVSALSARLEQNRVILSWSPAPGVTGTNTIIRSDTPVTAFSILQAEVRGSVSTDETTFTDTIESGEAWYYAILTTSSDGQRYTFFLPSSNALIEPVRSPGKETEAPPVEFVSFNTLARDDSVIITWTARHTDSGLLLYRSTVPFTSLASLTRAIPVSGFSGSRSPFIDYPLPGIPYYYALIDEQSIQSGSLRFIPGQNTSIMPVEASGGLMAFRRNNGPVSRPFPLPALNPVGRIQKNPVYFSEDTERLIRALVREAQVPDKSRRGFYADQLPVIGPRYLKQDMQDGLTGEQASLKNLIDRYFLPGDWNTCVAEVDRFLSIRRSADTVARSRFYRAQALFFMGKPREALYDFLLVWDHYPLDATEWISRSLDELLL